MNYLMLKLCSQYTAAVQNILAKAHTLEYTFLQHAASL